MMYTYRVAGRVTHKHITVDVPHVITVFIAWHVIVFALGQLLEMRPPCLVSDCDTVTQVVLWAYRFMAGN